MSNFNHQSIRHSLLLIVGLWLPSVLVSANTDNPKRQQQSAKAPAETVQYGQLVGNWKVRQYGLDNKGEWKEGGSADWNFYWILGGAAIQDDWIAPSLKDPAPESGRQLGTNIRIYNPKLKQWEMAWASNTGAKVDTFTAVEKDGSIVMRGIYTGVETRITFYDINQKTFSWKMETQTKETGTWKEVYRIEAKRMK